MKAIILSAGRGSRLGELTADIPKALVAVHGRSIIDYTFDALPDLIDEVIVVIGYHGEAIRKHLTESYRGRRVQYIEQTELRGTADAVWRCRSLLMVGERFLVLNGDDIYDRAEIAECLAPRECDEPIFAYTQAPAPAPTYLSIQFDAQQRIAGAVRASELAPNASAGADTGATPTINIATGVYVLDTTIFDYEPVLLSNGEYGLPQTILTMAKDKPVIGIEMQSWLSMNTKADIAKAEEIIAKKP